MSLHDQLSAIQPPDMTGIKPGSAEEMALHQQFRAEREKVETAEYQRIVADLGAVASEAGVVDPKVEQAVRHDQLTLTQ